MSTPEPAIADTPSPPRTVPGGPSQAGEPDRPSGAAGGTPCAGRATRLIEFVGGPANGYRIEAGPEAISYSVEDADGVYVLDPDGRAARWHVGLAIAEPTEQVRPAAPAEHVRPANREGEQTRPRRARRSGR